MYHTPRTAVNVLCTLTIWARSFRHPMIDMLSPHFPDKETEAQAGSRSFPQDQKVRGRAGVARQISLTRVGGGSSWTSPVDALCLTLTPFLTVILNKTPVPHVGYSSTWSPICYWISMLFHMKTINSREGLGLVSKKHNWKGIRSESSQQPSGLRPGPWKGFPGAFGSPRVPPAV